MAAKQPIPVLLSRALGHLTAELEEAPGPAAPSLAVYSNVLRCVGDGLDERGLPEAARISRRLATAAVTGVARRGWVELSGDTKNRHMVLTAAGRTGADDWGSRLAVFDAAWAGTPVRNVLEGLVADFEFELPHFPAPYGTADPSAIGGPAMQGVKRRDSLPTHGNDWKPVRRPDGDTVSSLPLTALLSQALMAFTIDYEDRFPWPLANTLNVLCHLGAEPRPLADVPGGHGITGAGKSLTERHLIAAVTTDPSDKRRKLVALTDRGQAVIKHHPGRLDTVEENWRQRYGVATVARLRKELGPLAKKGAGRPDYATAELHLG